MRVRRPLHMKYSKFKHVDTTVFYYRQCRTHQATQQSPRALGYFSISGPINEWDDLHLNHL